MKANNLVNFIKDRHVGNFVMLIKFSYYIETKKKDNGDKMNKFHTNSCFKNDIILFQSYFRNILL
jgi:hypothetical protein